MKHSLHAAPAALTRYARGRSPGPMRPAARHRVRTKRTVLGLLIAGMSLGAVASSGAASGERFKVGSSLDGKKVMPVRIRWRARPHIASSKVASVEFLIDRHLIWTEHRAAYFYGGNDGRIANQLITSFLKPGLHRFTVRADSRDGRTATDIVRARVVHAPPPPAQLAGTWTHNCWAAACDNGVVTLSIAGLGWGFEPQPPQGDRCDARYLSVDKVVFGPEVITSRRSPREAFCGIDPPFTYTCTLDA